MVEALDMFSSAVCVCDPPFTTLSVPNELLGATEYAEKLMQVCHFRRELDLVKRIQWCEGL